MTSDFDWILLLWQLFNVAAFVVIIYFLFKIYKLIKNKSK